MNAEIPPGCGVPVRHRRAGPRHLLAHRLRRAHLAHGRHRQPDLQQPDRRLARPHRRLLGRLVGRPGERPHQPDAGHPVADLRARHHGDPRPRPGQPADRARPHQLVLLLPHRARAGAVAEEPGLRPGGAHPGLWRPAHHVHPGAAQHPGAADRDRHARHGRRDPRRSGAVVPRPRHPPALPELGQHAVGGARPDHHRAVAVGLPGPRDLPHRARPQPAGRRPARHPRPAIDDAPAHERPIPSCKVDGLRIALAGNTTTYNAVEEVSFEIGRGEAFGLVGKSGCGKSITALAVMGLLQRPLVARRRPDRARRRGDPGRLGRPRCAALRGKRIAHDLPGADDGAQSAVAGRPADRRDVRAARGRRLERGDGPRRGGAAPGPRALARAAHQGLSAPAFGRHAPARDDRDRARLQPRAADRRRADHGARRHGAGRDHRPDGRAVRRQGHRHPDDQPRSRPGRQHVPARRGDVCRPHRRGAAGRGDLRHAAAIPTRRAWSTRCRGSASARAAAGRGCARSPASCRRSRAYPAGCRFNPRCPRGDRCLPVACRRRSPPLPADGLVRCHHHG